jgi:hypothetical protein
MTNASSESDRPTRLLKGFDLRAPNRRRALERVFDAELAEAVAAEAREEFSQLAPEIPYAEREKDLMASNIIGPTQTLAYALPLQRRGISNEKIGEFVAESFQPEADRVSWIPKFLIRWGSRIAGPLLQRQLRKQAEATQERDDPNEFVFDVAEEPDGSFGLNMTRCAVCTLFSRHDAMAVVPYICATDDQMSDSLGLGLRRTGTRALGASHCDFRYHAGGEPRRLRDHHDLSAELSEPSKNDALVANPS